jgi:FtsP/CotA-like multicopper oxidase with cupredoxin domain
MHIHAARFQVASRTGGPLDARHRGWKDTVVVEPFEQMSLLVKFAEHEGLFVAHCHNLEHAETGMMMNVQVGGTMSVEGWLEGIELDLS